MITLRIMFFKTGKSMSNKRWRLGGRDKKLNNIYFGIYTIYYDRFGIEEVVIHLSSSINSVIDRVIGVI